MRLPRWVASFLDRNHYLLETLSFRSRTIHWLFSESLSCLPTGKMADGLTWRPRALPLQVSSFTGVYLSSHRKKRHLRPNTKCFGDGREIVPGREPLTGGS